MPHEIVVIIVGALLAGTFYVLYKAAKAEFKAIMKEWKDGV